MSLWSHSWTKWLPFNEASYVSSPLLATMPTRCLRAHNDTNHPAGNPWGGPDSREKTNMILSLGRPREAHAAQGTYLSSNRASSRLILAAIAPDSHRLQFSGIQSTLLPWQQAVLREDEGKKKKRPFVKADKSCLKRVLSLCPEPCIERDGPGVIQALLRIITDMTDWAQGAQ